MITRVVLRRFKRFREETFELPGHVVIAGPNNCGKTTVLQAISAWSLAFEKWKALNDFQRHGGAYTRAPLARSGFWPVPLRTFDLLWQDRFDDQPIEIVLAVRGGPTITLELIRESTEQVYVRPKPDVEPAVLRATRVGTVFVPPMSGLGTEEPVYQPPKIQQLLGLGRPGEVLRNLLVQAHVSEPAWSSLVATVRRLFGSELLPPDATGADILADFQERADGPHLDIASGGSGFQQVLMLLAFLHTQPGAILLVDEPDAHLHVILQDAIYGELRSVAAQTGSQLIVATHSEVIIDSVEPRELCLLFDRPRFVADVAERAQLATAMGILSQTDVMRAMAAPGILYCEGHPDIEILRSLAGVLGHPATETLTTKLFWKPTVWEYRAGTRGILARDHYQALQLVRPDLPGLVILDGDDRPEIGPTPLSGQGLQRLRWRRYEIESYLVHPAAIERFVEHLLGGPEASREAVVFLRQHFTDKYPPPFLQDPLGEYPFLLGTKARTELLPPALAAAGIHGFPYTRYHEIAAVMRPEEIHPEVIEKLDAIQRAFRL